MLTTAHWARPAPERLLVSYGPRASWRCLRPHTCTRQVRFARKSRKAAGSKWAAEKWATCPASTLYEVQAYGGAVIYLTLLNGPGADPAACLQACLQAPLR